MRWCSRSQNSRRSCYSLLRCRMARFVSTRSPTVPRRSNDMTRTEPKTDLPAPRAAEIVREYGPFPGADKVHGVTHDGRHVWAATGAKLIAFDPESGDLNRTL